MLTDYESSHGALPHGVACGGRSSMCIWLPAGWLAATAALADSVTQLERAVEDARQHETGATKR